MQDFEGHPVEKLKEESTGNHKQKLGIEALWNCFREDSRELNINIPQHGVGTTVEKRFAEVKGSSTESETRESSSNHVAEFASKKNLQLVRTGETKQKKTVDEEVYCSFTYLSIMTALYLPFLLFLWVRRNVFGTEFIVRSLFFGHILRYAVAVLFLPPSVTKRFVPQSLQIFAQNILHRIERVQGNVPPFVNSFLGITLGMNTDKISISWGNQISSDLRLSPPFVMFGIVTLMLFIAHPDGFTWIMIEKFQ